MALGHIKLRIRTKLFIIYFSVFALMLIASWCLTYSLIKKGVDRDLSNQMGKALDAIHGMIVSAANQSPRNPLASPVERQSQSLARHRDNTRGIVQAHPTPNPVGTDLSATLSPFTFGKSGFAFIVDTRGGENITPDFSANPQLDISLMKALPLEESNSSPQGITITQRQDNQGESRRVIHAHQTIPGYGWTIVAAAYTDEFDHTLSGIRPIFLQTALLAIALILIITLWLGNHLQKPVQQIIKTLEQGSDGNFSVRINSPGNSHELDLLAGHFNRFIETCDHTTRELGLKILELKQSEDKIRTLAKFPDENPNPILRATPDLCLAYMNPSAERLVPENSFSVGKQLPPDLALKLKQCLESNSRGVEITVSKRAFFFDVNQVSDTKEIYLYGREITEKKKYKALLLLTDSVFNNSIEGITVTDANGIIQQVNPAFEAITGYPAGEVIGRNPRILKSDHNPPEFYGTMWESLGRTGQWNGEIWNRKKNGEAYPEWLSINAITNEKGDISSYVAIFHDMTEIRRNQDQLKFNTYHDSLTGLPNRLLFEDRLERLIAVADKSDTIVAVICLDLDNFKHVNQSLGLHMGDQVLQEVGHRLTGFLGAQTTVSRFSGDQFSIILTDLASPQAAAARAAGVMAQFQTPFILQEREIYLNISMGISLFPWDGGTGDSLVKNAEIAMHRTKETGKNSYSLFETGMNRKIGQRLELEAQLRQGLKKNEFKLFYQPKVSVKTGEISGMEALIRWDNREKGIISPGAFIPIAEETGIIGPMGTWVLNEACAQTKAWQDLGFDGLKVAVNLSAVQFRDKDLFKTIQKALDTSGLDPWFLNLEITESLLMNDVKGAIATMNEIVDLGICFSMDDFGTGYSSLAYLKRFPVSTLKVDQSFVREIPFNKDDMAISRTIISMAKSLNMTTVAEGVETEQQLEFMQKNGCDEIQGYYFSPPVPADQFLTLLKEKNQLTKSPQDHKNQRTQGEKI